MVLTAHSWLEVAQGVDEHVVGLVQPVELRQHRVHEHGVPRRCCDEWRHVIRPELNGELSSLLL